MEPYTTMGGAPGPFPATRWSIIRDCADPAATAHRDSLEKLAAIYWRPIYAYFRRKWNKSNDEAKDLTQDFFVALAQNEMLKRLSPDRGKFRSYVMGALDNFVRLDRRREGALKRGGGAQRFSIEANPGFDPPATQTPEETFHREWGGAILTDSLKEMEEDYGKRGAQASFQLFLLAEVDPPPEGALSYEELGRRFSMSVTDVRNHLYRARKTLRQIVTDKVRETVSTSEELDQEMRELFGNWSD